MKANCEEELKNTKNLYKELSLELESKEEFLLPFENSKRTIIRYLKTSKTNSKYPRRYDQIKKRPLQEVLMEYSYKKVQENIKDNDFRVKKKFGQNFIIDNNIINNIIKGAEIDSET